MISNGLEYFSNALSRGKRAVLYRSLFLAAFMAPVLFLTVSSYIRLSREATRLIVVQKRMDAFLAATIVRERLDAAVNLGVALSGRFLLIRGIEQNDWAGAIGRLQGTIETFPFIERIFLVDVHGVLKASLPSVPEVIGEDRSAREWFNGVRKNWEPYVSGVFERWSAPRLNVVGVSIPIRTAPEIGADGGSASGTGVIGILLLELKTDIFSSWVKEFEPGSGRFAYIVDQYGKVVFHPRFAPQAAIVDFSRVPIVQKLLKGMRGAEENYNPVEDETRVAAYEPVDKYGWGVVVTQPASRAFLERDGRLRHILIIYMIIIALTLALGVLVLSTLIAQKRVEDALRKLQAELRTMSLTDPLTGLCNRRGFETLAQQALRTARRSRHNVAVLFIDIDNMKSINDRWGHKEGDAALIAVARDLRRCFRESDVLARLGGDEFVVLTPAVDQTTVQVAVKRLQRIMDERNKRAGASYPIELSIGTAYAHAHEGQPEPIEILISRADKMMYAQKLEKKK